MRLWLVSHNYYPEPTGIPYYNTALAEWFAARGWDVEVLTGVPHYPWWSIPEAYAHRDYRQGRGDEVINGVMVRRVRHFVPPAPTSGRGRLRLDASYLWRWTVRSCALPHRPDIVLGVCPPFLMGGLLAWLRLHLRVPVVCHIQDLQVDAALDLGQLPSWTGPTLRLVERLVLRQADLVTTCGLGMLRRITAKSPLRRSPRHWPNWTDCSEMRPWSGLNPERSRLDQGRVGCVVGLYSGSLGRKQGLETLVEATRRVRNPAWRTVIVGTGSERPALERSSADVENLDLQDLRPAHRLCAMLAAADVHIIPQRREMADLALPSKLLNILAVGKPVVATAEPGTELHGLITTAGCGLVVPPDDPTALAAALDRLAADPGLRQRLGEAGRACALARYDASSVLPTIEADLLGLISATRSGSRRFRNCR